MASITKRKYWADPATGHEVKKGTPGAIRRESRFWRIRYQDSAGRVQSAKGYIDLRATRQLAARLEAQAARGEEGLVNAFAIHERRPLAAHVADYLAWLAANGRDDQNRQMLRYRLERLARECRWKSFRDITPASFDAWRQDRAGKPGSSGKTLNHFFDALRAFLNWCLSASRGGGRIAKNPIAGLEHLPHIQVFHRRALEPEELSALYAAAPPERWRVYAFAATTGLRRQEILDLQWGDVVLDATSPFLRLRAIATKARRADHLALKPEIAAMLLALRPPEWQPADRVFQKVPKVKELRADLTAGGVALPDGVLTRIDFHALRTTLGSMIGRHGIPERVGMELLRVTDPKLLRQTYCDPKILQTAAAANSLPIPTAPPAPPAHPQSQVKTGTDEMPVDTAANTEPGRIRTKKVVREGPSLSATGNINLTADGGRTLGFAGSSPPLAATGSQRPSGGKQRAKGIEPAKTLADLPANFRFPAPAGQKADKEPPAAPPDPFLAILTDLWPQLPRTVRESIVTLAHAAVDGGGR